MISKEEWIDWKANPVTKAFLLACVDRIEEAKEVLSYKAGQDLIEDNYFRGFIQAYREMLEFKIEDIPVED